MVAPKDAAKSLASLNRACFVEALNEPVFFAEQLQFSYCGELKTDDGCQSLGSKEESLLPTEAVLILAHVT